ncbi:hypothetical protein D3C75_1233370 [compost metagenome]
MVTVLGEQSESDPTKQRCTSTGCQVLAFVVIGFFAAFLIDAGMRDADINQIIARNGFVSGDDSGQSQEYRMETIVFTVKNAHWVIT